MNTRGRFGLLAVLLSLTLPAHAAQVVPGQGVTFHQIDFTFATASQPASSYGMLIVDFAAVASATGVADGYLNVATANGWVVRNVPVDVNAGLPGVGTMFELGNSPGTPVPSITALVDVSALPTDSFVGSPSTVFGVSRLPYNAEGFESVRTAPPAPLSLATLAGSGGETSPVSSRLG